MAFSLSATFVRQVSLQIGLPNSRCVFLNGRTSTSRLSTLFATASLRSFSTVPPSGTNTTRPSSALTQPNLLHSNSGRAFMAMQLPKFTKKLKPYIVKRRLKRMRTYIGQEKDIRHSPKRMNLVCNLAAGLTLDDALLQLQFCQKRMAPLVQKVLMRTSNLAEMKDGLQRSQLEVAECFTTRGTPLKRIMIMGRGRSGKMEHKFSHIRVVLREIDFKLRIYQAPSINQKKKWFLRQQTAEAAYKEASVKRAEKEELTRQAEANKAKQEAKED